MKFIKPIALVMLSLLSPTFQGVQAQSILKNKVVSTVIVGISTLMVPKEKKEEEEKRVIRTNKKGEQFTFHGNGQVSVKGPFGEDLGTHRTNKSDPSLNESVQLIKQGNETIIYVGKLGIKGGCNAISSSLDEYLEKGGKKENYHAVTCFHVSCKSDRPESYYPKQNYAGVVLYMYDNKKDWYLNGVHCKTGYIILKNTETESFKKFKEESTEGQVHGAVYMSVFNQNIGSKVVGTGFAYYGKGKMKTWRYNSQSLNNQSDGYHLLSGEMGDTEKGYVSKAVKNWIEKGHQNTFVRKNGFALVKAIKNYSTPEDRVCVNVGCSIL